MMLQARLEEAFTQMGWVRIPEIIHHHAEEAAAQNISYLRVLGQAFARRNHGQEGSIYSNEDTFGSFTLP